MSCELVFYFKRDHFRYTNELRIQSETANQCETALKLTHISVEWYWSLDSGDIRSLAIFAVQQIQLDWRQPFRRAHIQCCRAFFADSRLPRCVCENQRGKKERNLPADVCNVCANGKEAASWPLPTPHVSRATFAYTRILIPRTSEWQRAQKPAIKRRVIGKSTTTTKVKRLSISENASRHAHRSRSHSLRRPYTLWVFDVDVPLPIRRTQNSNRFPISNVRLNGFKSNLFKQALKKSARDIKLRFDIVISFVSLPRTIHTRRSELHAQLLINAHRHTFHFVYGFAVASCDCPVIDWARRSNEFGLAQLHNGVAAKSRARRSPRRWLRAEKEMQWCSHRKSGALVYCY